MNKKMSEFISRVEEPTRQIKENIYFLQTIITGLEKKIVDRDVQSSKSDTRERKVLKDDLKTLNELLVRSYEEELQIKDKNSDKVYTEAVDLILENRKRYKKTELNNEELKTVEREFVKLLWPYLGFGCVEKRGNILKLINESVNSLFYL